MRKMFNLLVMATLLTTTAALAAPQIKIVGSKSASKNPTLYVNKSSYAAAAKKLEILLKFSDWFEITSSSQSADYQLRVIGQTATSLSVQIKGQSGMSEAFKNSSPKGKLLYRKTADAIINRVFNKTGRKKIGICASQIAFIAEHKKNKEVYIGLPDALDRSKQITGYRKRCVEPDWSPDNKKLLYTIYLPSGINIMQLDLINKTHRYISASRGLNSGGSYSPDGKKMAMLLSKDGSVEIYVMDLRTFKKKRLTRNRFEEGSPCWSPDSSKILAVTNSGRVPNLCLYDIASGRGSILYKTGSECQSPDWSPISGKICFAKRTGRNFSIAVLNPQKPSEGVKVITKIAGNWESPSWAPDGRHIVCVREYQGKKQLYMIDSWYGKAKKISNLTTTTLPSWSSLY